MVLGGVGIVVAALALGVWIGGQAGGAVAPVTPQEHAAIAAYARTDFDHPFTQLKQLSYRVERIADPEPGPCRDEQLGGWTGTDDAAWHVTAFTIFGLPAGGMTITCDRSWVH